jgi:hypothetical protein
LGLAEDTRFAFLYPSAVVASSLYLLLVERRPGDEVICEFLSLRAIKTYLAKPSARLQVQYLFLGNTTEEEETVDLTQVPGCERCWPTTS